MREDLLHFIWKNNKLRGKSLATEKGQPIEVYQSGTLNLFAGPDFFNAKLNIGGQVWAGNVEMHIKSSDWYIHGHEADLRYNNVILHVVWENDVEVFRKDGSSIPVLELKTIVDKEFLNSYNNLLRNTKKSFINCESQLLQIDSFIIKNWQERLYIERLQDKSALLFQLLEDSQNDWEKVLFCMLLKNFGLNRNGNAFLELGKAIDFSIIRKVAPNILQLEALLLGVSGLLDGLEGVHSYEKQLINEYNFLKIKFQLKSQVAKPEFFGLRPSNFPTIRLAQLAQLYHKTQNIFRKVITDGAGVDTSVFKEVAASDYWNTHYNFGKVSTHRRKKISKTFIDLLVINTLIPVKFAYQKHLGKLQPEVLIVQMRSLSSEKNTINTNYKNLGVPVENALDSQANLQLYHKYCVKNKCLQCALGHQLLRRNS
ncbi:DUF2851 family protein [Croceivirga sp. JEA036]|uniref:DUF2851 family protein n=1 Tax=Croceivirga sp. JEA036 TaxID=2721162 RepID=UPI0014395E92|nr:DUF2851 family protein [Croceivirga sp. JEA036]NJB35934.1 DUF2851 family protein [Croceivirga sp. JEA036]